MNHSNPKMLKNLLFSLLFFLPFVLFSQQNNKLDRSNGFKGVKLGTHFQDLSSHLSHVGEQDGVQMYHYNNFCCKKVFGYNVDLVTLGFKDDRMVNIIFSISQIDVDMKKYYNGLNASISKKFGNPDKCVAQYAFMDGYCFWYGKKVELESTYKSFGDSGTFLIKIKDKAFYDNLNL